MTTTEKALVIVFIFILCMWGVSWLLDDWYNDR